MIDRPFTETDNLGAKAAKVMKQFRLQRDLFFTQTVAAIEGHNVVQLRIQLGDELPFFKLRWDFNA